MLAAIVSAFAAFLVGMGLGRRQQAADDRRQWDKDIKTEFIKIVELLKVIRSSSGLAPNSTALQTAAANMNVALGEMDGIRLSMSVSAHPRTLKALDELIRKAFLIHEEAHNGGQLSNIRAEGLAAAEAKFTKAVKKNLRLKAK